MWKGRWQMQRTLGPGKPETAGLSADGLRRAHLVLERAIDRGLIPGAVYLVARYGVVAAEAALGQAMLEPDVRPMAVDTIFDLASITKVAATTPALLILAEQGMISLGEPLPAHFAEATGKEHVTIGDLLLHTSGLPAWLPLYAMSDSPEEAIAVICRSPLEFTPGTRVQYSCLGMILLGELVRRLTGMPLDRFVQDHIYTPLGMTDTCFRPPSSRRTRIAATERGNQVEKVMVRQGGYQFDRWREEVMVGEVNDGNAHYAMGGISGNAGVFSTARDLAVLGQLFLNGGSYGGARILGPLTVQAATSCQTHPLSAERGWGFAIRPERVYAEPWVPSGRAAGELFSRAAYGHSGFTGTCLWMDPVCGMVVVLLTNRTHPVADGRFNYMVRPRFFNAVAGSVL